MVGDGLVDPPRADQRAPRERDGVGDAALDNDGTVEVDGRTISFTGLEPMDMIGMAVANVVFPCGYTIGPDGDTMNLYYGGADTCVAVAKASVRGLLVWLDRNDRPDCENPDQWPQ